MSRKKIRIAIFHLAFVYSGGGERLVLEEVRELGRRGYEAVCFAPVVDQEKCFPELIKKVKVEKILPTILPSWFLDQPLISILAACIFVPFVFYKFKNFDFYFGANQPGVWIAYILSKINRKPYAGYLAQPTRLIHPRLIDQQVGLRIRDGFSLLNFMNFILKPFIHWADVISIRNANKVFVNGSYAKGLIDQVYGINSVLCPAGAVVSNTKNRVSGTKNRFSGFTTLNGIHIKKPFILLTNRNYAHKKFEYAIEAVGLMKKSLPLVITGEETDYTGFLKRKYRNKKNVIFTGLLSEKELEQAYINAAVYVYPAPEEDFGMGIVEAMGYGVPVVAWGNAGPTGIITHGKDGLLARPFEVSDFAAQVESLLIYPPLYRTISKGAVERVKEMFTYERHVNILEKWLKAKR